MQYQQVFQRQCTVQHTSQEHQLLRGIISSFGHKKFGFIKVEGTDDPVFFHMRDAAFVGNCGGVPGFTGSLRKARGKAQRPRQPQVGDLVVFELTKSETDEQGRDKAAPWGYADDYDEATKWLREHPLMRVFKRYRSHKPGIKVPEAQPVWMGRDPLKLAVQFPLVLNGSKVESDAFNPKTGKNGVVTTLELQMQTDPENDVWARCPDPRPSLCCIPDGVFARHARDGAMKPLCHHN